MKDQYKQEILKWETLLFNIDFNINANQKGEEDKYHILYRTKHLESGTFYIGIHSNSKLKDDYLGCGIRRNIINTTSKYTQNALKRSRLWRAVNKYGTKAFIRENLLFFKNREDLLLAESMLIDKEFVKAQWNYNNTIGGSHPPINKGSDNGNFNNKWSEEKKEELSKYFQLTRNTKGANNNRARSCVAIDLLTRDMQTFNCFADLADTLNMARSSINTWSASDDRLGKVVRAQKYFIISLETYQNLSKDQLIIKIKNCIKNSRQTLNIKTLSLLWL